MVEEGNSYSNAQSKSKFILSLFILASFEAMKGDQIILFLTDFKLHIYSRTQYLIPAPCPSIWLLMP